MKTYPECLSCLLKQTIQTVKFAKVKNKLQQKTIKFIEKNFLPYVNLSFCPPKISRNMHIKIKNLIKVNDPYVHVKIKYNKIAMSLYKSLKNKIKKSDDKLLTAIKIAVAGNIIDFGAQLTFDIKKDLSDVLNKNFAIFDYKKLKQKLKSVKDILYLADNTGETIFDRILIEQLIETYNSSVIYAVKEKPILNDATFEDAVFAGIDKYAQIISCGADSPGIVLEYCNKEFLKIFNKSKLIISKGQGNFEALDKIKKPIFFLFKIKCDVVSDYMNLPVGSIILKSNL